MPMNIFDLRMNGYSTETAVSLLTLHYSDFYRCCQRILCTDDPHDQQKHPYFKSRSSYVPFRYVDRYRRNMFVFGVIVSINEKLPMTRVHLTQEQIWIFLDRELPSVQLSFLWYTVLWIGTTENGVRHTWMHDALSLMNTRYFHWVLWELAKWWWFLKVWTSLALFDGIIETISMAFSRNIFQAYTGIFVFKNNVFTFW